MQILCAQGLRLHLSHMQEGRTGAGLVQEIISWIIQESFFIGWACGAPDKLLCARDLELLPLHHLFLLPKGALCSLVLSVHAVLEEENCLGLSPEPFGVSAGCWSWTRCCWACPCLQRWMIQEGFLWLPFHISFYIAQVQGPASSCGRALSDTNEDEEELNWGLGPVRCWSRSCRLMVIPLWVVGGRQWWASCSSGWSPRVGFTAPGGDWR